MAVPESRQVIITGGSGTLGFHVARVIAMQGQYQVILPVRRIIPVLSTIGPGVEIIETELCCREQVHALIERHRPEVFVHCAASGLRPSKPSWFDQVSFNVEVTLRLFEEYCHSAARKFLYVSTGLVYHEQGRPLRESDPLESLHPYGASKSAADQLLQAAAVEFGRDLTIVRPFAFTGRQDFVPRLFPALLRTAVNHEVFHMTAGDQVRDFCAVEDVARGIALCLERTSESRIEKFNFGSGLMLPLRELVESVRSELNLEVEIQYGQLPLLAADPRHLVADATAARTKLGWEPNTRLAYAVWELAQEMAPELPLRKPERLICATVN